MTKFAIPASRSGPARSPWHALRLILVIATVAFGIAETAYQSRALQGLDQAYTDFWHRWSGVRYEPRHTALVVVNEASLARFPDDPLAFWPPHFAKAAATLREAGAEVIGIDFLFSLTPESWLNRMNLSTSAALRQYDLAFRQELNAGKIALVGTIVHGEDGQPDNLLLPHPDYLLSLPNMDLVAGIGLADLEPDADGVIRRFRTVPQKNLPPQLAAGAPRLSIAALLALRASGQNPAVDSWRIGGIGYSADTVRHISYAGPPGTIPRIPFHRLLEKDALTDPAVQALRGKVVIIGGDFLGMNDIHPTPYSGSLAGRLGTRVAGTPGPEIQASIAETLLSGTLTVESPAVLRWAVFAVVLFLITGILLRTTPWTGFAAVVGASLLALIFGYGVFQKFQLFPAAPLQLGLAAGFLMVLGLRLTREERDKVRIRSMFEGYVSDDVVNMLLESGQRLDMGGQSMHITVLFSDIRNFTTISEKLSAHETVEFLNVYFEKVIGVIRAEGGRIDKFIGDAVMAEFGVPYPFPDHAARALRAATGMRLVAEEFRGWMRQRFPDRDLPDFGIGIGVHTGDAVVGNLGSSQRMEFTAIGDTVNVASRLEGETKALSCVIVASLDTVRAAGGMVETGRHETLKVKGRTEAIEAYEILAIKA